MPLKPSPHPVTPMDEPGEASAVLSACGMYRYWLERGEPKAPYVAWVLANPSTADAEIDDPTVRKGRGFSTRWNYKRFVFVNVLAYRATNPGSLRRLGSQAVGPLNENYLREVAEHADMVVVAWGNAIISEHRHRARMALTLLRSLHRKPIMCLGYTADRQPRHPLMLAYATQLEEYVP